MTGDKPDLAEVLSTCRAALVRAARLYCAMACLGASSVVLYASIAAFGSYAGTHPVSSLVKFLILQRSEQDVSGPFQINMFDLSLLIPYFIVLIVLASYGFHRYQLIWMYYRNKKHGGLASGKVWEHLPRVTIQLPVNNEQHSVEQLIDCVCRLDYPPELLDIQVLDDSNDETAEIVAAAVEHYRTLRHDIAHIHRNERSGKASALENGLKTCKGEFVAIFECGFNPPRDWLHKVVHQFADPKVGMVQTRWTYRNRSDSFLTEVEAILLDGHFVLEQGARYRSGTFIESSGAAGMWRLSTIRDAGGWQFDTLTEDSDLSYRAQLKGWQFRYLSDVECPTELPDRMSVFKMQQERSAKGLIQCAIKCLPAILNSNISKRQKIEAWYHLTANLSYPLMVVLSVLLMPAMIIRFYQGWFQMLYIDLPLFMASTFSISSFYLVSQKELFPGKWHRTFLYLPFLMSLGIGLTITNSKAVVEALIGEQMAFVRTPKYRVKKGKSSVSVRKLSKSFGLIPWIELAIGCYFALACWYAISNENYITVPFLLLFVVGYWYTGFLTLIQPLVQELVATSNKEARIHELGFDEGYARVFARVGPVGG